MSKPKTLLFSFHLFLDLLEDSRELATKERRSVSSIINQALDEFLEKRKNAQKSGE